MNTVKLNIWLDLHEDGKLKANVANLLSDLGIDYREYRGKMIVSFDDINRSDYKDYDHARSMMNFCRAAGASFSES